LYATHLVTLRSKRTKGPPFVTLFAPERRSKATRAVIIAILFFLIAVPVGATAALATSRGENHSKLSPNCLTLRANQGSVIPSGSGVILFTCGDNPALTVGKSDRFRPVFTLPTGYTGLKIVNHALGTTDCNHGLILVSGQRLDLSGPGNFDYCAGYANAPSTGLASFKVTWSK
jgi:hypothetical protein